MELVQQKLMTSLFKFILNCFFSSIHLFLWALRLLISSSKWKKNLSTSPVKLVNDKPVVSVQLAGPFLEEERCEEIRMEKLIAVMDRLGIMGCENEEENWSRNVRVDKFAALFDEEPSLEEIKEAFEVFDENKDGYIEATELQRILCGLCIKGGEEAEYGLEECRRMLCAFDDNGDGLIDFTEFVTFMDKLE